MACPAETPNWDPYRKKCYAPCPDGRLYWGALDSYLKQCFSCRMAYLSEDGRWNPNSHFCVLGCPAETPDADGERCKTCAEAHSDRQFWSPRAEKCVAACPEFSVDGVCTTCYEQDEEAPYWDAAT